MSLWAKASSRSPKSLVPLHTRVARDVAALREHKGHVALGVDHDVIIERLGKVEQRLEHLVVDLDELERLVGGLLGLGGDDRHLLVLVAHQVLKNQAVVGTKAADSSGRRW